MFEGESIVHYYENLVGSDALPLVLIILGIMLVILGIYSLVKIKKSKK